MGKYGNSAVRAAQSGTKDPRKAWVAATKHYHAHAKDCPLTAYLALCESGYVRGVSPGSYLQNPNTINVTRALDIRTRVMSIPNAPWPALTNKALWKLVGGSASGDQGVIDVIKSLHSSGLLQ